MWNGNGIFTVEGTNFTSLNNDNLYKPSFLVEAGEDHKKDNQDTSLEFKFKSNVVDSVGLTMQVEVDDLPTATIEISHNNVSGFPSE